MTNKSLSLLMLMLSISLIARLPVTSATIPTAIPNKSTMYVDSIGMPETVDPGWLYDTAAAAIVMNVYDTLVFFDHEQTAEFIPLLAVDTGTEVTPSIDPGFDHSIIFEVRTGVTFHDGSALTPDDVEYTFERWMGLDRSGGPTWMIFEALFGPGTYHAHTSWANDTSNPIATHVQSNSSHVWFNFDTPYSTTIFKQVIAQSWAGILDKDWAVANGLWDGNWTNWLLYHDPPVSPLDDPVPIMMGSGPYKLKNLDYIAETYELEWFPDYWGGWPARGASGYVDNVVVQTIIEWSARKLRFLSDGPASQADLTVVWRSNTPELDPEVAAGRVRFIKDLPVPRLSTLFFNFHIPTEEEFPGHGSPYMGNGLFSEGGIPWDFFQDENVRRGFAHILDISSLIVDMYLGEAEQPATPLLRGVGFDDLYTEENEALKYTYNLTLAEYYLRRAWADRVAEDGTGTVGLWDTGFTLVFPCKTGGGPQHPISHMLEDGLEGLNPKFHVTIQYVDWSTIVYGLLNTPIYKSKLPIWLLGWVADYPDPHTFMFPLYHSSRGLTPFSFILLQSWEEVAPDEVSVDPFSGEETPIPNGIPDCDERIEYALVATRRDGHGVPISRKEAYRKLMYTWHVDLPSVPLTQILTRHYERTWVQGWYYNPIRPGNYYYHLWKGIDGDINGDLTANILDACQINLYWGPVTTTTARKADIAPELAPDGKVNIADAACLNAHWGETYTPP